MISNGLFRRGGKCKFKPFGFLGSRNINEHKGECGFYLDENTMSGRNAPDWLKWKDCPKCGRYEDPNRGIHLCQVCGSAKLVALVTQTQSPNAPLHMQRGHGWIPCGKIPKALIKERSGITQIEVFTADPTTWTNPSFAIMVLASSPEER